MSKSSVAGMKTSTVIDIPAPPGSAPAAHGLPWRSLLTLGAVTFVVVVGEMLPTAVLPQMSADLGVPQARTGLLVSLWAATVVVTSLPLVRLTARWDRRTVAAGALVVFALSAVATALATTYPAALAGRLVGGAVCGLVWATVNSHTAAVVPERHLSRAVAVVLAGATLGTVLGVPAANLAARALDWRAGFWAVAAASLVVAALVRLVVAGEPGDAGPERAVAARATTTAPGRDDGRPELRAIAAVAGLTGLVLAGHYGVFTFVAVLLEPAAAWAPGGTSGLLLLFGVVSAVAVASIGRVPTARTHRALVVAAAAVAVALVAVPTLGAHPAADLAVVVAWAATSAVVAPLGQTLVMRLAGTRHRRTAGAVVPVTFNLGIAVGAALGSGVVDRAGPGVLPVAGAVVVLVAAAALATTTARRVAPAPPAPTP